MQQILILGGGAAGLAAALAAAQTAEGRAHITVLDKNAKVGKKLLATGNGRCNLDNRDITPERYFTSSPKALRRLLSAVDEAAPLAWFENLGLYPRTDEAGRVYPYSNQAADVLALLEGHIARLGVEVCQTLQAEIVQLSLLKQFNSGFYPIIAEACARTDANCPHLKKSLPLNVIF